MTSTAYDEAMGRSLAGLVASVLIFGVLAATVLGAVGTTASVAPIASAPIEDSPRDGTFAVSSKSSEGGLQVFGITLRPKNYHLDVTAIVPIECIALDAVGQQQLNSGRACPALPAGATLSGGGITATGDGIATGRLRVLQACYDATSLGATWPSVLPECASE